MFIYLFIYPERGVQPRPTPPNSNQKQRKRRMMGNKVIGTQDLSSAWKYWKSKSIRNFFKQRKGKKKTNEITWPWFLPILLFLSSSIRTHCQGSYMSRRGQGLGER